MVENYLEQVQKYELIFACNVFKKAFWKKLKKEQAKLKNMNKLELIEKLKTEARITRPEAVRIVNLFFDEMSYALSKNERVEIRGLFSMFLKNYESYTGRNPKTGEKVTIQPKKLPFFKAGKELKDRINSKK